MGELFFSLLELVGVFIVVLIGKKIVPERTKEWCAICIANTITWLTLLLLYQFNMYTNIILIALMMGLTLLGLYYTFEKMVSAPLLVLRLPLLLILIFGGYSILTKTVDFQGLLLVAGIWVIFLILYAYRQNPSFKTTITHLVECCKKW